MKDWLSSNYSVNTSKTLDRRKKYWKRSLKESVRREPKIFRGNSGPWKTFYQPLHSFTIICRNLSVLLVLFHRQTAGMASVPSMNKAYGFVREYFRVHSRKRALAEIFKKWINIFPIGATYV